MAEKTSENTIPQENTALEKFLIFTIQEKWYALPAKTISEVTVLEDVFPLPLAPEYVKGIINRYSIPYALIDIKFLLVNDSSNARKMIVFKEEIDKLAFLIDDVADIADIPTGQLMKIEQEDTALISAFFEWKGSHILCLDIGELLNRIRNDFQQ
ncbi:MAG: chemotaxis protein CheW [Treponema sp.]|jgi:purine-binding chemotaxis protein CheW|nr:chemotaxis protein CheW [Treponema sp.]